MGFVRAKIYNLHFEQPDLADLEVKVRSLPIEKYLAVKAMLSSDAPIANKEADSRAALADNLISWNLEDDDGQPVPATLAGLESQDFLFTDALIGAWFTTIAGAPIPLGPPSNDGPRSLAVVDLERSIPMEAPSASQAS